MPQDEFADDGHVSRVIMAESNRWHLRDWCRGWPVYAILSLVMAAVFASLHVMGFFMGLVYGAMVCAWPLLIRRALVFTPEGYVYAVMPSLLRPPARLKPVQRAPVSYAEIESIWLPSTESGPELRVELRNGTVLGMECGYCNVPVDVARATILGWMSG